MRIAIACFVSLFLTLSFTAQLSAQQAQTVPATSGTSASPVPRLIKFSGVLLDHQGQPLKGPVGVTFSLYAQQSGDSPLWMETQNVELDEKGVYAVLLGSNTATGLPEELFFTGDARWLGIQPERESELPRVLLVSAPYALKAADADTIRGLPPSAFVLANGSQATAGATNSASAPPLTSAARNVTSAVNGNVTGKGVVNYIPMWDTTTDIVDSVIFQSGSQIGIGTATPAAALDVNGAVNASTSFNLGGTPFAFGSFANRNSFLGFAGNATTTGSFNTASGFVALYANTTGSANTASGANTLKSNTTGVNNTASGVGALFSNTTGDNNTAIGASVLGSNTTGFRNTAIGDDALSSNISGYYNTANGSAALMNNTMGNFNTASGISALGSNTTGTLLTCIGYSCDVAANGLSNATAIGAHATVSESNALVLGSISGVNGATANVNIGIGTTTPLHTLDVHGTGNFTGPVTFATGQTFPGTGTITGVIAGTDLTGGGTVGNVTLDLNTTKVPRLAAANIFVGNQTVTGNITSSGEVQGGVVNATTGFDVAGTPFAFGSVKTFSAFLGFAGNATSRGNFNTADGYQALLSNSTGFNNTANGAFTLASNITGGYNTASGINALNSNTAGSSNTASGGSALRHNTTGSSNTASGGNALRYNTTGSYNTALGYAAGSDSTQPGLNNATAIGAYADVAESNALVLGSINGVNGATASARVGIGTATPLHTLDVHGTGNFTGPVNFAAGQTFPGTITSVSPGTGLTSSVIGSNVTLNVDTTKVPQLSAANTFAASQTVIGSVTATNVSATGITGGVVNAMSVNATGAINGGVVNATTAFDIGGTPFAFGSFANRNSFLGFGGNPTSTATDNTATGYLALSSDTTGFENTASGVNALHVNSTGTGNTATGVYALYSNTTGSINIASGSGALFYNTTGNGNTASGGNALYSNTMGYYNTASGANALYYNTAGYYNTASGLNALFYNTTGSNNTASGVFALYSNTTGTLLTCIGYGCNTSADGLKNATAIGANAVVGESNALVLGSVSGVNNATSSTNVGIGTTTPQYPLDVNGNANFSGNVSIGGSLSKGSGSFKIDHPLDPANKYLYHSFVESPDMMNVYNGNVVTDKHGMATVVLPEYFEALNRDFRYQLTVVGQFAQAIVSKKVEQNRFVIRTSKPNVEVSWQVTGIRQDAYANAHRIEVEEDKPQQEQGHYLHPELFRAPPEQAVGYQAASTPTRADTARVSTSPAPSSPLK